MSAVVALEFAVGEVPHLHQLVPSRGDDDGILGKGRKSHAGNPLGVALLLDSVLADSEGVPQFDGAVAGSRHDLAVIGRESNRQNVLSVADETTGLNFSFTKIESSDENRKIFKTT